MLLKQDASIEKLNGRYFTPNLISDFVTEWVLAQEGEIKNILEPSVGEGVFLSSAIKFDKVSESNIIAVEIDEDTSKEASAKNDFIHFPDWKSFSDLADNIEPKRVVVNDDFYYAYKNGLDKLKFQGILGNPPYIRYQYLTEEQRAEQSEILINNSMKPNKLINAWVSFTVACISCMDDSSRIGIVIPAELLQVKYSQDLRRYLVRELNRCTIVTFENLVFDDIEQEVVLLLGEKIAGDQQNLIKIVPFNNAESLDVNILEEIEFIGADLSSSKWTKFFLDNSQIDILKKIKSSNKFLKFSQIAKCEVGITTGNNKYFCLDDETVKKYSLEKYCRPLIARSVNINGVQFLPEDWNENILKGARTYLLDLSPFDSRDFNDGLNKYIKLGEENKHNTSYKTRIREEWYKVPSVWSPDIFFLRRNYQFPKVMLNTSEVDAVSTDTMHRVRLKNPQHKKRLIVAYYTTVGLLFSELEGRSYGGGVLEILPSEVSNIQLPNIFENDILSEEEVDKLFDKIDNHIRINGNDNIEILLDMVDSEVLINKLKISKEEVTNMREAWHTLKNRRLGRGRNNLD